MYDRLKPPLRIAVIVPDNSPRPALVASLNQDCRFSIIGEFGSLAESYTKVEAQRPDLVICDKTLTQQAEFPMFAAMLQIIGTTFVAVRDDADARSIARMIGLGAAAPPSPEAPPRPLPDTPFRLVAIGASTGGIEALSQVLSTYPKLCPPTLVVQHIKPEYLSAVVDRLDRACPAQVVTATAQRLLRPGMVVFAPGSPTHLEVQPRSMRCMLTEAPPMSGHRPSIDVLFHSIAALKDQAVGVLLTGMGRDGATGMAAMRRAGAWTIAQDAETSTVHGMPRVAAEEGAACEVLPLHRIGKAILSAATPQAAARPG